MLLADILIASYHPMSRIPAAGLRSLTPTFTPEVRGHRIVRNATKLGLRAISIACALAPALRLQVARLLQIPAAADSVINQRGTITDNVRRHGKAVLTCRYYLAGNVPILLLAIASTCLIMPVRGARPWLGEFNLCLLIIRTS